MSTNLDGVIDIACAPATAFRFVTDPANDVKWQPTVRESHAVPSGPWIVGTEIVQRRRFAGLRFKTRWRVLEIEPDRRVRSRMGGVMAVGLGDYRFEPTAAGTRFRMTVVGRARWFVWPLEPWLRSRARLEVPTSLSRLKSALEG